MNDVRLELPESYDDASRIYRRNAVVNRIVSEVARHVPASADAVLRRDYGNVLRLPAMLVFGTTPDRDAADEALPECVSLCESLDGVPSLVTETDDEFDRYVSLGAGVAHSNPRGSPARFRLLDDEDGRIGEGVEFTDGEVAISWSHATDGERAETYRTLSKAERSVAPEVRFAFDDPRPPTDDRGPVVTDGGTTRPRDDEGDA